MEQREEEIQPEQVLELPFEVDEQAVQEGQQVLTELHTNTVNVLLTNVLLVAGVAGILALALTPEQRVAIREGRDGGACQFPHPHGDECRGQLQVHHIRPQRFLKDRGLTEEEIDIPENLLTVCEHSHHDHIHLDMARAKKLYRSDKNSYKEAFVARKQQMDNGKPYWNTAYDKTLKYLAQSRTITAMREGWTYPLRRRPDEQRAHGGDD